MRRKPVVRHYVLVLLVSLLMLALAGCAMPGGTAAPTTTPAGDPLLVAAAADLQFAFAEIGAVYEERTGQRVTFTFGSSGNLTSQIENGAPFDVLAAANVAFIDRLREQDLIFPDTQQLYGRGRIVLAVNRESGAEATTLEGLLDPSITRIAIANPAHAPYGQAAQQALESRRLWEAVQPKLVLGENIAQALQFVQTGDAQVGIIALSIAEVPEVTYTLLDEDLHQPLDQALAVIRATPREEAARAFVAFVMGPEGREIMRRYGFALPGEAG
jgi:molybdate transport system substrate-binding protein